jgi:hypothetical protein
MKSILLILSIGLLTACASKNDKLLNQFEYKVEQYENLAINNVEFGDPQLDTLYNQIDAIMNELLSSTLTDEETNRATQLSLRLQVAIDGIKESNEPTFEIDLNQILQGIENTPAE